DGYSVVFVGRPNAGKSSLVNALLGTGRMIVSHEPGTTRDTVEEVVDLGGVAFVLTDTAGLRRTTSAAEREAISRTREKAAGADILVGVFDRSVALSDEDRQLLEELARRPSLVAVNKCDLPAHWSAPELKWPGAAAAIVETSARTGAGCDRLAACLVELVAGETAVQRETPAISRVRHRVALENATDRLRAAIELMHVHGDRAPELVAVELRAAITELAGITEPLDNEEVLDKIFSQFCIGK
ncbi:MAG: GTP-binding protein, partial [Deltaproteobacteria bacterium]